MDKNRRLGNKKMSLLLVLRALEKYSDEEHPVKQIVLARMVNMMGETMGMDLSCDRKTAGRHLKLLEAVGYPIKAVKGKGYFIEGNLTDADCATLIAVVRKSDLLDEVKENVVGKLQRIQSALNYADLKKHLTKKEN